MAAGLQCDLDQLVGGEFAAIFQGKRMHTHLRETQDTQNGMHHGDSLEMAPLFMRAELELRKQRALCKPMDAFPVTASQACVDASCVFIDDSSAKTLPLARYGLRKRW